MPIPSRADSHSYIFILNAWFRTMATTDDSHKKGRAKELREFDPNWANIQTNTCMTMTAVLSTDPLLRSSELGER